ncbi:SDR family oxidoreductase [Saccharopolyspora sp. SCSIO 74807]|uniref:SDR family oxidoreductase n=1 Tax=Saccharopolyspora sp. SCSIO 74807 TaxID=3118084 RepID=UPI0030D5DF4F
MKRIDAFVTGGTGFIGRWLLPELTGGGRRVAVLLRDNPDGRHRLAELREWVEARGGRSDLLHGLAGDLTRDDLGMDPADLALARTASQVFHLGAAMSFGLPAEQARQVNVRGSERVAELAASGSSLDRLVLISGFQHRRSSKLATSRYHDSKLTADARVRDIAEATGVPLTRVHPASVTGDSRTGQTSQFWGWPDLVQALHRGRLPIVPGVRDHRLPLVAVDHLAKFLAGAPELAETAGGQYWLLHDTPPLADLLRIVADELGVATPRLRVPIPLAAMSLQAGLDRWTGISAEALTFLTAQDLPVAEARRVESTLGLTQPDVAELARVTARFLADHGFRPTAS